MDYTNEVFGRWTVEIDGIKVVQTRYCWCKCECGNRRLVAKGNLGRNSFSCGCLTKEANTTHGHSRIGSATYTSWKKMRGRCNNPNDDRYADYGGRGIAVCERWNEFAYFLTDMGERPDGCTLDRIDNDSDYSPENCRWASSELQASNRRCKGYHRVDDIKRSERYVAQIRRDGKTHHLGTFATASEARKAYEAAKADKLRCLTA